MGTYLIYALEVQCEGLLVQVLLNGAAVFEEPAGGRRFAQGKLNPWIVDGPNQLEVLAGPPPGQELGQDAALKLLVIKGPHGELPGPDANAVSFTWNEADYPLEPDQMVRVLDTPVPVDEGHGRWAWQDAAPFAPGDEGDIAALVMQAAQVLTSRDTAGYLALLDLENEEMSRALDVPAAELAQDISDVLREQFAADDWQVEPVDPAALRYAPTANGRLIRVTDDLGRPPLRGMGGGQTFETSLTVSHLSRGWTIVR
ncbi:MAG: hypothetical protein DRI90_07270 [Deltaproteobacteria bacterium]|nr:MAG: hypothetical protein DRI90_07270 [Deltaproteobacteria bacterium]